jgi:replicative DNA helicase
MSFLINRVDYWNSTGFKDLDNKLQGIQKGDLIVVAGRPSMGKTSLAMNIAENVLLR